MPVQYMQHAAGAQYKISAEIKSTLTFEDLEISTYLSVFKLSAFS